jgi:DNA-binding IscR family transcriptional regulator
MRTEEVGYSMLKLTKKADYGLMALKFLAEHPERPALSAKDVADAYGIPACCARTPA